MKTLPVLPATIHLRKMRVAATPKADKAMRDAAMVRMHEMMDIDSRFDGEQNPVPFDGKRMRFFSTASPSEVAARSRARGLRLETGAKQRLRYTPSDREPAE